MKKRGDSQKAFKKIYLSNDLHFWERTVAMGQLNHIVQKQDLNPKVWHYATSYAFNLNPTLWKRWRAPVKPTLLFTTRADLCQKQPVFRRNVDETIGAFGVIIGTKNGPKMRRSILAK